jgi:hypothetical protein
VDLDAVPAKLKWLDVIDRALNRVCGGYEASRAGLFSKIRPSQRSGLLKDQALSKIRV